MKEILDTIEMALARAGYEVMDMDQQNIVIRDAKKDMDFKITVEEIS